MCGIFGTNQKISENKIDKLLNLQNHRGPDDKQFFQNDQITLLHNRLSILDIENGSQPMSFKDLIIIFNGEIFNSPSLRSMLQNKGYSFLTKNSDTEVLLKLYDFKGIEMLSELNGMFSFVIYDKKKNLLFGAVDQFSIKPLYYSFLQNKFFFSSEIKPLLELEYISKDLSISSIKSFFQLQYVPFENTIYENVKKLKNNHYFVFDLSNRTLNTKKYEVKKNLIKFNNYSDIVLGGKEALNNSIKNWSLSDVPIACSLSGGLDSSLIASIFASNSSKKIKTITVGYEGFDKIHDERNYAKLLSEYINSDHTEIVINPKDILLDLNIIFENLAEPYAGSLASWHVYKNLKNEKVIFTGTGADEIFGNYGKWKNYILSDFFLKNSLNFFKNQKLTDLKYFYGFFYNKIFYEKEINKLIKQKEDLNLNYLIHSLVSSNTSGIKKKAQEIDFNLQLPYEFLYVTDRLSMMNSIEARTPFLDNEMVDYINSIPSKHMSNLLNSKKLLKDISYGQIPTKIIERSKMGFVLPKENWLKKELLENLKNYTSEAFLKKQNIFSQNYIENLLNRFLNSKNNSNLTEKVWTYFIFQFWYEKNYLTS
jgi:asparagine synthase (glutamine-hydrolysing)